MHYSVEVNITSLHFADNLGWVSFYNIGHLNSLRCTFFILTFYATLLSDKLVVENRSFFLTCVWCFMTWKWGFLLFFYSRKYRRELTKQDSIRILDGQ